MKTGVFNCGKWQPPRALDYLLYARHSLEAKQLPPEQRVLTIRCGMGKTSLLTYLWEQAHELAHAALIKDRDHALGISTDMGAGGRSAVRGMGGRIFAVRPVTTIREVCERYADRVQQSFTHLVRWAQRAINRLIGELLRAMRTADLRPDAIFLVEIAWFLYHGVGRPPRFGSQALAGCGRCVSGGPSSVPPSPNCL